MQKKNRLNGVVSKINSFPKSIRPFALSFVFGKTIRFARTAKIRIEKLNERESFLTIKNRKKVQNHIGSVHAAAMALLAESATGFIVGLNVPDKNVIVIKSMNINYVKRATGDLKAKAWLTQEQIDFIHREDKGDITVGITVSDEKGVEPIICEMIWAWTPKHR